jgi:hypothetical protein
MAGPGGAGSAVVRPGPATSVVRSSAVSVNAMAEWGEPSDGCQTACAR